MKKLGKEPTIYPGASNIGAPHLGASARKIDNDVGVETGTAPRAPKLA